MCFGRREDAESKTIYNIGGLCFKSLSSHDFRLWTEDKRPATNSDAYAAIDAQL